MLVLVPILAATIITISAPTSTAQVGIAYNSSCAASGGVPPYNYSISSGALPTGLGLNTGTGAITGTPTVAGQFQFTCAVTDSFVPVLTSPNTGEATARSGRVAKASSPQSSSFSTFTITVAAAPSPTPVPPSIWMAMMGLAGAGMFRMRQLRRG
jgi:hypothetical protein